MGNKITKDVAKIDSGSVGVKGAKKKAVGYVDDCQKVQEGGGWSSQGFGAEADKDRLERQKNYAKADYIEPPEPSMEDLMGPNPYVAPDPVKKPTMRNVGVTEPTKKYLKHFANDEVLKEGHNVSQKGILSYKGEGRGNS